MATPVKDTAWLEWIAGLLGIASRQTYTATLPPDRFHCVLDELPLHLIPQGFFRSERVRRLVEQPLVFNPRCSIFPAGQTPCELAGRKDLLSGFAQQGTIAWVSDGNAPLPFWLSPRLETVVRSLRFDQAPPIPEPDRFLLAAARILRPREQMGPRIPLAGEHLASEGLAFHEKAYVPLRGLIHPFHVAALRRYYRHQLRHGAFRLGDDGNPLRYVAKNECVARFFHHQLTSTVSAVAGQPVKPSYVYFASYSSGAELIKHTDRPQCEFSVTLCLDFSPDPARETSWPIRLDTPAGTVALYQALGDGLMYRGPRVPHYRSPLPEGRTSTSIFFHYVAADFKGPLD